MSGKVDLKFFYQSNQTIQNFFMVFVLLQHEFFTAASVLFPFHSIRSFIVTECFLVHPPVYPSTAVIQLNYTTSNDTGQNGLCQTLI